MEGMSPIGDALIKHSRASGRGIVSAHERDFAKNRAAYDSGKKAKSELIYAAGRFPLTLRS